MSILSFALHPMCRHLILTLLFGLGLSLHGQLPYAVHYGAADGLGSDAFYDLHQDRRGFIWVAGAAGLYRFDGNEAVPFRHTDQSSLAGSNIVEDRLGRIWFQDFDGHVFYVRNDSMHALGNRPNFGYCPLAVTSRHIMVLQRQGIDVYDLNTLRLLKTFPFDGNAFEDANGNDSLACFIINHSLLLIDAGLNLRQIPLTDSHCPAPRLLASAFGAIWITAKYRKGGYIQSYNLQNGTLRAHRSQGNGICFRIQGEGGKLWILGSNGALALEPRIDKEWLPAADSLFSGRPVSALSKDRQNNTWICSPTEGLYLLPRNAPLRHNLPAEPVHALTADKEACWMVRGNGIFSRWKPGSGFKDVFTQNDGITTYFLQSDPSGHLLYCNSRFHIRRLSDYKETADYAYSVKDAARLDDQYILLASSRNALLLELPLAGARPGAWQQSFRRHVIHDMPKVAQLLQGRFKAVAAEKDAGYAYLQSNSGLLRVHPEGSTEIKYRQQAVFAQQLLIWNGHLCALRNDGSILLPEKDSGFVLQDNDGRTLRGIRRIQLAGERLLALGEDAVYLFQSNFRGTVLPFPAGAVGNRDIAFLLNRIYLLADNGWYEMDLQSPPDPFATPLLVLRGLLLHDKRVNSTRFDHDHSQISIAFSLLDFGSLSNSRLEYSINESGWIPTDPKSGRIVFNRLAPGNYQIRFRLNSHLLPEILRFSVAPPFYRSNSFLLLIAGLAITAGFMLYRRRERRYREKFSFLEEKVRLEKELSHSVLTAIRSQMNPHFFYNALNSIQAFLYTDNRRKASTYLSKFSRLTRMILEMSGSERIRLQDEIEALTLYLELEKMRFDDALEFSIHCDAAVDQEWIQIPPMLIQPYVENAVKHGLLHLQGEKHLAISFSLLGEMLQVTIDDNGIGREASAAMRAQQPYHQAYATGANLKRLELLHQHLPNSKPVQFTDKYHPDGRPAGTRVTLQIPIS